MVNDLFRLYPRLLESLPVVLTVFEDVIYLFGNEWCLVLFKLDRGRGFYLGRPRVFVSKFQRQVGKLFVHMVIKLV